jgi:WD40 repeat protein
MVYVIRDDAKNCRCRIQRCELQVDRCYTPDGRTLGTSITPFPTISFWDDPTHLEGEPREFNNYSGVSSCSFSADGTTLAVASEDYTVRLRDVASGDEICVLYGHTREVTSVCFSPDGRYLASGCQDDTVCIWDIVGDSHEGTIHGNS